MQMNQTETKSILVMQHMTRKQELIPVMLYMISCPHHNPHHLPGNLAILTNKPPFVPHQQNVERYDKQSHTSLNSTPHGAQC